MLDVVGRSQRGRVCDFKRGELSVRTPVVLRSYDSASTDPMYVTIREARRSLVVMGSEMLLDTELLTSVSSGIITEPVCKDGVCVLRLPVTGEEAIPDDIDMIVVPNAYELRKDPRKLVDSVIKIRTLAGYNRLVCMLGIAEPSTVALLTYMGVDVFDDSLARAAGLRGISLIPEGEIAVGTDVSEENCKELATECNKIITFAMAERLRELIDQRASSSPSSVAILRLFDRIGYEYQEEACSTVGCRFACNTTQALRRPDIQCYKNKISERYTRPIHKRVLLLLPCSAKKPYHTSKTHKAFSMAIHTTDKDSLVHEVIVTSPLGIVPRELDVFYPANSYDIPVTGEWKPEEKETIRTMVGDLIAQGGYEKVISHLGEDTELIRGLADMEETVIGDSTSPASLQRLDEAIRAATKEMKPVDPYIERRETVRSVLAFQFGKEAADLLMNENAYALGKFPYWKIIWENPENRKEKIQLGMLTPERGMVSLTMDGAEFLAKADMFTVEMTDFEMKGNLFAVGVVKADPRIRIGDEAIIILNGKVKAVGVAMMSGVEMVELKRGIAVKVRHKSK